MSTVLRFPQLREPPPSPVDRVHRALEENRRSLRRRWRREGRRSGRKSRRLVLTVGAPPAHDDDARTIWALGAALLSAAEAAFDVSVSLHGNADKVLRKYIRLTRKIARNFDTAAKAKRDVRGHE